MRKTIYILVVALMSLGIAVGGCGDDDGGDGETAQGAGATADSASDAAGGSGGGESGSGDQADSDADRSAGGSTAGLSKAFAKRVDAICLRGADRVRAYLTRPAVQREPAARMAHKTIDAALAPYFRKVAGELEGLAGSAGEEAEADKFAAALRREVATVEGDRSEISSHVQLSSYFRDSSALADELGLRSCAYGP